MKIPLLTALLLTPLYTQAANAQFTSAPTTGDVHDVQVVSTADQEARAPLLGQPTIASWKEKHLVVAYQKGIAGNGDMGSIDAIVSTNDGNSWSIRAGAAPGGSVSFLPCAGSDHLPEPEKSKTL